MRVLLLLSLLSVPAAADPGVAVIELFTSEGCSSCPPAEALLNRIDREAREKSQPVYVLAFHVGYWDYLGWTDRFAAPAHVRRQQDYAARLDNGRVYTPQMVVSGAEAFVGSDEARARGAIDRALARPAQKLSLKVRERDGRVEVSAGGRAIAAAIVENRASSKVTRGENAGKRLFHEGVVRAFATGEKPRLKVPKGIDRDRLEVVAFSQDPKSGRVTAAARRPLKTGR
jgi:hypothetical protein